MIVKLNGVVRRRYSSPLPKKYRWRNWAANAEGLTGDSLKEFIDNEMFPALQNLEINNKDERALVVRSVFEDAYNYMKSGHLINKLLTKYKKV